MPAVGCSSWQNKVLLPVLLIYVLLELTLDVLVWYFAQGKTALHVAAHQDLSDLETVQLLLSKGAQINAIDNSVSEPLHVTPCDSFVMMQQSCAFMEK